MRKVLKGAFMLAAAGAIFAVSPSVGAEEAGGATASAPALAASSVAVDAVNQKLTIDADGYREIGFSIASVNKNGEIKPAADNAWEWHDVSGSAVTVDLSSLSNVKDNYVQVKTDKGSQLTIKIPAAEKKTKAKYDAVKHTVTLTVNGNEVDKDAVIEYKNQYGSWAEYDPSVLSSYEYKGASLTFRIAAKEDTDVVAAKDELTYKKSKTESEKVKYFIANSFPSKEAKASVKKMANGPKVGLNYAKGTITIPKNSEFRFNYDGESTLGAWQRTDDKLTLAAAGYVAKKGAVEARTLATEKKGMSKTFRTGFEAVDVLNVKGAGSATGSAVASGDVKDASLTVSGAELTVSYLKDTKDESKILGITITNKTNSAYQVYVSDGKAPEGTVKATAKVGAATDSKPTVNVNIKNCDGKTIYICKSGNAKASVWPTAYVPLGKVTYPVKADDPVVSGPSVSGAATN